MGVTKRDLSGVFDAELSVKRTKKTSAFDNAFHLSQKGITFFSEQGVPEWTEVGVRMHLPQKGVRKDPSISCRAVVVECSPRQGDRGYRVTLLFLNLPKRAQAQLALPPLGVSPASISISR